MQANDDSQLAELPLSGCRVLERSRSVACAYAGRLLASLGAQVIMLEPTSGSLLREAAPVFEATGESALFAYLAVGKRSLSCEPLSTEGQSLLRRELDRADILLDDTPVLDRAAQGLDPTEIARRYPQLVHVSVLPFGAIGPKSSWDAEEINLIHSGGEGFLLPNGFSSELFPDRPPLKIYGHFAGYQGGATAAFGALSAWWALPQAGGQFVDVSIQDAALAVGAFALQRLGDGSLEHRKTRSFRYGGVFEARDGYIELLTLEDRQWLALVELLGRPDWATDESLLDPLERSRRGEDINRHIREWMAQHDVEDIVTGAQDLGVPAAKYRTPNEVVHGEHELARGLFAPLMLDSGLAAQVMVAPFQFRTSPLRGGGRVPGLNELANEEST